MSEAFICTNPFAAIQYTGVNDKDDPNYGVDNSDEVIAWFGEKLDDRTMNQGWTLFRKRTVAPQMKLSVGRRLRDSQSWILVPGDWLLFGYHPLRFFVEKSSAMRYRYLPFEKYQIAKRLYRNVGELNESYELNEVDGITDAVIDRILDRILDRLKVNDRD